MYLTGSELHGEYFVRLQHFIVCQPTDVCATNFGLLQNTKTTSWSEYSLSREVRTRQPDDVLLITVISPEGIHIIFESRRSDGVHV